MVRGNANVKNVFFCMIGVKLVVRSLILLASSYATGVT